MSAADYIAAGIIFFLLICAVRYIVLSQKKGGCGGCCGSCSGCSVKNKDGKTK